MCVCIDIRIQFLKEEKKPALAPKRGNRTYSEGEDVRTTMLFDIGCSQNDLMVRVTHPSL